MRDHDWQHQGVDAETVLAKNGERQKTDQLILTWRCALCRAETTTKTGTKTITIPHPTRESAHAQGVDPDCDQETVNQVHAL